MVNPRAPSPASAAAATPAGTEHTPGEELAHAMTHGLGAALAAAGLTLLVSVAASTRTSTHVLACGVYGLSLVLLYLASTIFHAVPARLRRAKEIFKRLDHGAIYLLIAGTYTPFTLLALPAPWGLVLLAIIWSLATIGLGATTASLLGRQTRRRQLIYERASLVLYLFMGWLGVLALGHLGEVLTPASLELLLGGGVAYTLGVFFFLAKKKWAHSIWHGFVLVGSGMHFFSILLLL